MVTGGQSNPTLLDLFYFLSLDHFSGKQVWTFVRPSAFDHAPLQDGKPRKVSKQTCAEPPNDDQGNVKRAVVTV